MNKPPFTITKDVSANYKTLKLLEKKDLIQIFRVKIENEVKGIKTEHLPNAVFGHVKFGETVFVSDEQSQIFEKIKAIIGPSNIKDAIFVATHIREKNNYCVTEDNDILSNKEALERAFPGLQVRSTDQLVQELDPK